ncbi:MAG: hypothetical protein HY985_01960 [Magnetospirillum sp.]|nr:hypothetical protein [Magnetospirillum sp.]
MYFDYATILSNKVLLAMLAVSMAAAIPYYLWFSAPRRLPAGRTGLAWFFAAWLAAMVVEFVVLGPASFIGWDGEGNLAVAVYHLLAHRTEQGTFSHAFAGGIDLAAMNVGLQYVSVEVWLARLLPTWGAIAAHKAMVASLGFWGAWLLARPLVGGRRGLAAAAAVGFPVAHAYLLNYSTEFGTGFAVLPLAVHVLIQDAGSRRFWLKAAAVATLVALAEPMKIFPALAVAMLAAAIVLGVARPWRTVGGFALCVGLSLLNWHEVLFGLVQVATLTNRGQMPVDHGLVANLLAMPSLVQDLPVSAAVLVAAVIGLAAVEPRQAARLALAVAAVFATFLVLQCFPWEAIGLALVNQLAHIYIRLSLPVVAVIGVARLLGTLRSELAVRRAAAALVAVALAVLTWTKLSDVAQLLWFGGQAAYFTHHDLQEPSWRPTEDFRVVTLHDYPQPNITAAFYGFDTFDGHALLSPARWVEFWTAALAPSPAFATTTRTRIDWTRWNGAAYEIDRHVRLDLLAVGNVRILFSALPLAGTGIRVLRAPKDGDRTTRVQPSMFPSFSAFLADRLHRVFAAGDLWIYALDGPVAPRVFAAQAVETVGDDVDEAAFLDRVAALAPRGVAVARAAEAARLGAPAAMAVRGWERLPDGYRIAVDAPLGGVLVINNTFLPFWRAETADRELALEPVNGVHMAAAIPPGTTTVSVRYHRPTIRALLARRLGGVS